MTEEKPDAELLAAFATEARQRCDVIATGLDTGTSDYETFSARRRMPFTGPLPPSV